MSSKTKRETKEKIPRDSFVISNEFDESWDDIPLEKKSTKPVVVERVVVEHEDPPRLVKLLPRFINGNSFFLRNLDMDDLSVMISGSCPGSCVRLEYLKGDPRSCLVVVYFRQISQREKAKSLVSHWLRHTLLYHRALVLEKTYSRFHLTLEDASKSIGATMYSLKDKLVLAAPKPDAPDEIKQLLAQGPVLLDSVGGVTVHSVTDFKHRKAICAREKKPLVLSGKQFTAPNNSTLDGTTLEIPSKDSVKAQTSPKTERNILESADSKATELMPVLPFQDRVAKSKVMRRPSLTPNETNGLIPCESRPPKRRKLNNTELRVNETLGENKPPDTLTGAEVNPSQDMAMKREQVWSPTRGRIPKKNKPTRSELPNNGQSSHDLNHNGPLAVKEEPTTPSLRYSESIRAQDQGTNGASSENNDPRYSNTIVKTEPVVLAQSKSVAGPSVAAASETTPTPPLMKKLSPKAALKSFFDQLTANKIKLSDQNYVTWDSERLLHSKLYTSIFVDPRTGECFPSGPLKDDKTSVFAKNLYWFQSKLLAEHGAAAVAWDSLTYRELWQSGKDMANFKPLGRNDPLKLLENRPPRTTRLPPEVVKQLSKAAARTALDGVDLPNVSKKGLQSRSSPMLMPSPKNTKSPILLRNGALVSAAPPLPFQQHVTPSNQPDNPFRENQSFRGPMADPGQQQRAQSNASVEEKLPKQQQYDSTLLGSGQPQHNHGLQPAAVAPLLKTSDSKESDLGQNESPVPNSPYRPPKRVIQDPRYVAPPLQENLGHTSDDSELPRLEEEMLSSLEQEQLNTPHQIEHRNFTSTWRAVPLKGILTSARENASRSTNQSNSIETQKKKVQFKEGRLVRKFDGNLPPDRSHDMAAYEPSPQTPQSQSSSEDPKIEASERKYNVYRAVELGSFLDVLELFESGAVSDFTGDDFLKLRSSIYARRGDRDFAQKDVILKVYLLALEVSRQARALKRWTSLHIVVEKIESEFSGVVPSIPWEQGELQLQLALNRFHNKNNQAPVSNQLLFQEDFPESQLLVPSNPPPHAKVHHNAQVDSRRVLELRLKRKNQTSAEWETIGQSDISLQSLYVESIKTRKGCCTHVENITTSDSYLISSTACLQIYHVDDPVYQENKRRDWVQKLDQIIEWILRFNEGLTEEERKRCMFSMEVPVGGTTLLHTAVMLREERSIWTLKSYGAVVSPSVIIQLGEENRDDDFRHRVQQILWV